MTWVLEHKLCLNNMPVPFVKKDMEFDDIHHIASLPDEDITFSLLSLKVTDNADWLSRALQPEVKSAAASRRWMSRLSSVALVKEIFEAISKGKPTGPQARLSRRPNIVVAIEIRGQVILVVNQTRHITLAFQEGQELEGMQWFLTELQKDLETINEDDQEDKEENLEEKSEDDEEDKEGDQEFEDLHIQLQKKYLERLRMHEQCKRASWPPSKPCYRVLNKDKATKHFVVQDLKKRRKDFTHRGDPLNLQVLQTNHDRAYQEAVGWLDSFSDRPSAPAAASSSRPSPA